MDELISDIGPNGNVQAHAEDDGRVIYLYMRGTKGDGLPTCSVWVRNRLKAPTELDVEDMRLGNPPLMPATFCRRPEGGPPLRRDDLRLVWLPEGDGVALYEGDNLLAAIPPWAHRSKFHGYSSEAVGEGPLAWDLDSAEAIRQRFADGESYWSAWSQKPKPWPAVQSHQMAAYAEIFGKELRYFAIDNQTWPPKGLAWHETEKAIVLVTIGVALRPQPQIEMSMDDPRPHRRIELGIMLRKPVEDALIKALAVFLSGQSGLPWLRYTWLGHGHSIPCDVLQPMGFSAVLLARSDHIGTAVPLPDCFGDPVTLLWLIPISESERSVAQKLGSASVLAQIQYPR